MNNTNRHNIPDMSNLPNLHNNMSMNPQLSLSMPPSSMNMNMGGNMNINSHLSLGLDLDLDMDDLSDDDILATSIGGMSSGSMDGGQHGHNNGGMEHRQNGGNRNGNGNSPPGSLHYQPTRNDEMHGIPLGYENRHPSNLNHGANDPHGSGTVNTSDLTGSMQPQGGRYDMGSTVGAPPSSSTQGQQRQQQYQQQVEQTASREPPANPVPPGLSEDKARALEALLVKFWTRQMDLAERGSEGGSSAQQNGSGGGQDAANGGKDEFKNFALPLARIKKVMKSDPEVKMISAEVPVLLGKCCEIFIAELTSRAWLVAQSNKRRTLQKSDVAAAIGYSDMFDFLIDIVPRDEAKGAGTDSNNAGGNGGSNNNNSGGTANAAMAGTVDGTVPVPGLGVKRKNPGNDEDDLGRKRQREEADDSE